MVICIDFDGTCVDHRYPDIGPDAPFAVETLKELANFGHKLILFTMRSNIGLVDAIGWFKERNIPLYAIQFNPEQNSWSTSNKCYAELYIDDAAFGCPLIHPEGFNRPCVDWTKVIIKFTEEKQLCGNLIQVVMKQLKEDVFAQS
jgi:hypothetical protein